MSVEEIRETYIKSLVVPGTAERFITSEHLNTELLSPVSLAYFAMLEALASRDSFTPFSQLHHFRRAETLFNRAVYLEPNSIEIRLLRFGMMSKAPGFLRDNKQLREDKELIISGLEELSEEFFDKELLIGQLEIVKDSFYSSTSDRDKIQLVVQKLKK